MVKAKQNLAGGRVRKLRTAEGLSQEQLAARCQTAGWDVSRGTLAKIEAGVRRLNDAEVVILAKALRVPVADLLDGFPDRQALAVVRQGLT
jgi:transcriptional regulator with XRE-family HTH domain